jgi:hypothetical protein
MDKVDALRLVDDLGSLPKGVGRDEFATLLVSDDQLAEIVRRQLELTELGKELERTPEKDRKREQLREETRDHLARARALA